MSAADPHPGERRRQYSFRDFTLDLERGVLRRGIEEVTLRPKSFEVLTYLVEHHGRLVTKAEMAESVWRDMAVMDNSLAQCLVEIRRALGDNSQELIRTVARRGYLFTASVTTPAMEFPRTSQLSSVAVLLFQNLSPDAGNEYFSGGLTEEVTGALTRAGVMRVSCCASASFKKTPADIRKIGAELNVDAVLAGSVRKFHDRVRITAQLLRSDDSSHLWSQTYERTLDDPLAVQEEISRAIVSSLCIRVLGKQDGALSKRRTRNVEAFNYYLQGRSALERWERKSVEKAAEVFEAAIAADPEYPLPYAGMAHAYLWLGTLGTIPPVDLTRKARLGLQKALELDDDLAEAHTILGTFISRHEWEWPAAEREYHRALELAPGMASAHNEYATELLAPLGRFDEALLENCRARELDPFSPAIAAGYPFILVLQRRFEFAAEEYGRLIARDPQNPGLRTGRGMALLGGGKIEEALREYQMAVEGDPSPQNIAFLAAVLAYSGKADVALERLGELERLSQSQYVPALCRAFVHLALGDNERALELMEKAWDLRESLLRFLKVAFPYDPLRSEPRFRSLMRNLHLESEPGPDSKP